MSEVTRFAPSPTGALHLGNARTFLLNYLLARSNGWRILLRIEDIDGPRIRQGADQEALDDLRWLGLSWDSPAQYQSAELAKYQAVAMDLLRRGLAYPCVCTRSEVETAASAPHASDGATAYPGTCRGRFTSIEAAQRETGRQPCLRFALGSGDFQYVDAFAEITTLQLQSLGDFVIQKADGTPSYQLACALDDALSGVTQVVRGEDLIESVPRQVALMRALGFEHLPTYWHLPLVTGTDGRRLAKRHGDTRLATYRRAGVQPGQVLALLARWSNLRVRAGRLAAADDLLDGFDITAVPRAAVAMQAGDDAFRTGV